MDKKPAGAIHETLINGVRKVISETGDDKLIVVMQDDQGTQVTISLRHEAARRLIELLGRALPKRTT
jgi:hypothetical protein